MPSFEYIWEYLSTRCCILSFKVFVLLVPKKEVVEGFLSYIEHRSRLGYVNRTFEHISIPTSHGGSI